jgi:anti-sigma-K factor RskA
MTSDDQELHTLAGAFVLDAVSDQERASFAAHLAACAQCRDEVAELREAAARLGTAQAVQPRPELKERTIRAAYRTGQVGPVVPEQASTEQERAGGPRRRPRAGRVRATAPSVLTAAAAAVVAAAIALGTHYADMRDQQPAGRAAQTIDAVLNAPDAVMRTAPISSGGMAVVVSSRHEHMAVFIAHGLRGLPAARGYELWLMGPSGERSAGMLMMHSRRMAGPSLIRGVASGDMVGVTIEPASGSPHPTSLPLVLVGASP